MCFNSLLRQFSFSPKKVFALLVVLIFNVLLSFTFSCLTGMFRLSHFFHCKHFSYLYPISRATDIMGSKDKCCEPRVNAAADCRNNVRPLASLSQNRPIHIRGVVERPTLRGCLLRHILAGLSLCSNACPAKRPSLRACIDRMSFVGWDRIAFRSRIYM